MAVALSGRGGARIDLSTRDLTISSPGVFDPDAQIERSQVRAVVFDAGEGGHRFQIEPVADSGATVHDRSWERRYADEAGLLWLYPEHPPTAIPVVNPNSKLVPDLLILFEQRMTLPAAAETNGFVGGIVQAVRMFRAPRGPSRHRPVQGVFCAVEDLDAARGAFANWPLADRVPYDVIQPPPPLPDDPEDKPTI
jgi:hypothetical protein